MFHFILIKKPSKCVLKITALKPLESFQNLKVSFQRLVFPLKCSADLVQLTAKDRSFALYNFF